MSPRSTRRFRGGFSLSETIVALALFGLTAPVLVGLLAVALEGAGEVARNYVVAAVTTNARAQFQADLDWPRPGNALWFDADGNPVADEKTAVYRVVPRFLPESSSPYLDRLVLEFSESGRNDPFARRFLQRVRLVDGAPRSARP